MAVEGMNQRYYSIQPVGEGALSCHSRNKMPTIFTTRTDFAIAQ